MVMPILQLALPVTHGGRGGGGGAGVIVRRWLLRAKLAPLCSKVHYVLGFVQLLQNMLRVTMGNSSVIFF